MGAGCNSVNRPQALTRSNITLSSMRSCNRSPIRVSWASDSVGLLSKPDFSDTRYSMTRSTRRTARPQLCAMSVALEAQGDTVPKRGVTTITAPPVGPAYGSP